ncbi:Uncharacterised protein [Mycobacteroides abscessus subsp. abscessus]|nr:Uncharacterised protein [Mycobacteroides abscessus subsp. abscessus]
MVGDILRNRSNRHQLLVTHQPVEQLRVVHHLVVATDLWVFIAERVEAVCAGHHDLALFLLHAFEHRIEQLDVLHGQLLEQELVTGAASGVTRAGLVRAQHEELRPGQSQQLGDGLGGLLGAILVGARAADPEQVLEVGEAVDILAEHRHVEVDLFDPVETVLGVLAPGVAFVLQILEQPRELAGELRLDEHLIAAHVDDVVDVLDIDGALLDAGTAGGAAPQHLVIDHGTFAADQWPFALGDLGLAQLGLVLTGKQVGGLGVGVIAQRGDEQLGRQGLAGVPGGALALAAAALGTGGDVQQVLPAEVLDLPGTKRVDIRVGALHFQYLAAGHHRLGCTQCDGAVGVALEVDVEEGCEAVPRNTPDQLASDQQQEQTTGHHLDEREDRHHDRALGQQLGDIHGEEVGRGVAVVEGGDLARLHQDHAEALDQNDHFDRVRGEEVGAAETRQPLGLPRVVELPNHDQGRDADDRADTQELVPQVPQEGVADDRPMEFGVEGLAI